MKEAVVEFAGVSKIFPSRRGRVAALQDASFAVYRGDVFGLLGANGAGKTTAMRCLLGLTRIDDGTLRVLGHVRPDRRTLFSRAAYLPEEPQAFARATARENLHYHARLCGLPKNRLAGRVSEVLRQVGLAEDGDRLLGTFSKGMKQRFGIAAVILHEPQLLFLDEPTRGLDPIGRRQVRDLLADLADRGVTIFLNSHLLGEVERLCNRVAILAEGHVRAEGRLDELLTAREGLVVRFSLPEEAGGGDWPQASRADGGLWKMTVDDTAQLAELSRRIAGEGGRVVSAQTERIKLEDFFIRVVGEKEKS